MSVKSQIIQEYEEEIKKETPQTQIDISHPFNMKTFWKNINEKHFGKTSMNINFLINTN